MDNQISEQAKQYLNALYSLAGGDPDVQVSMYEAGAAVGMDKADAGRMAENLMVEELVELRTLSGGISITVNGLSLLGVSTPSAAGSSALTLGKGPVLDEEGRKSLERILDEIRSILPGCAIAYAQLEEAMIDMKTIDIQLLSPKAKVEIVRHVLRSLEANLGDAAGAALRGNLKALIES